MTPLPAPEIPRSPCRLVVWHTEGTSISGLLSWMWRLKQSLPESGIELTLVSLEIQPFRFPQVCPIEKIYDVRIRTPQELIAFLKKNLAAVHIINHAYEYIELLEKLSPAILQRLTLVGICHTDQDYYYQNLRRHDHHLRGIIAVSPVCVTKLEKFLPRRRGAIPVLPAWDMPVDEAPAVRALDPKEPLRLLFNGRIIDFQKRVLDLPEISHRLALAGANVELTIVGDGPDLPRLREAFTQREHIPYGFLPPRAPWEMEPVLAAHEVFLQVSDFEGASVSLMEAMVAGLAPVVTHTQSGTDLLQEGRNALLCPVGDVEAIAAKIACLAKHRERLPELGRQAFQTARAYLKNLGYNRRLRDYLDGLPASAVAAAA